MAVLTFLWKEDLNIHLSHPVLKNKLLYSRGDFFPGNYCTFKVFGFVGVRTKNLFGFPAMQGDLTTTTVTATSTSKSNRFRACLYDMSQPG